MVPTVVGVSVGFVFLVALIVVLIIILVVVSRASGRKKDYHMTQSSIENTHADCGIAENGELAPTGYHQMSHLSPNHPTSCESCSQISTIDTYIEDPSPRHNPPSYSSRSSHSHSSNSCPSTQHYKQKPLPRYGIPDHYPQYTTSQYSFPPGNLSLQGPPQLLGPNGIPEISVITPTPTMENQPVLGEFDQCMSPTGTEPFSSPNTPSDDKQVYFKESSQNRPSNLPIGSANQGIESTGSTPLSDQTMIGVLLYLQHKDCNKRDNCQTCRLIDRHFERIANKYGENALTGMMRNLNTPGAEGTLKQLRKREKKTQRIRSPHRPQVPLSLDVIYKRQRSHSASHIDDEELTFSSTETEEDSLKPSHRRVKPMKRRAVTDDERETDFDYHQRLPLQRINEGLSLSQHDIPTTPMDGIHRLPGVGGVKGKGQIVSSESDSTDGSTTSANLPYEKSGLSASYTKSIDVEESVPPGYLSNPEFHSNPKGSSTYYSTSSGYDTDSVFLNNRTISSGSEQESMPSFLPNGQSFHGSHSTLRHDNGSIGSSSTSKRSHQHYHPSSANQSDYLKAASSRRGSNLSPSSSGVLSTHSSPDKYRYGSQASNSSNQSNHSVHSESAALLNYQPKPHKQHFYSPPQQRKHTRTPSPLQLTLPSDASSATPI